MSTSTPSSSTGSSSNARKAGSSSTRPRHPAMTRGAGARRDPAPGAAAAGAPGARIRRPSRALRTGSPRSHPSWPRSSAPRSRGGSPSAGTRHPVGRLGGEPPELAGAPAGRARPTWTASICTPTCGCRPTIAPGWSTVPVSAPPPAGPGPAAAPGRWTGGGRAEAGLARWDDAPGVRAPRVPREAGRADPRPEINLLLYHGVLAPHARWRPEVWAMVGWRPRPPRMTPPRPARVRAPTAQLDLGGPHAPRVRARRVGLPELWRADAGDRHGRGPGRGAADPRRPT